MCTYGGRRLEEVLGGHDAEICEVGEVAVEKLQKGDRGRIGDCTEHEHGRGGAGEEGDVVFWEDAVEVDALDWPAGHDGGGGAGRADELF